MVLVIAILRSNDYDDDNDASCCSVGHYSIIMRVGDETKYLWFVTIHIPFFELKVETHVKLNRDRELICKVAETVSLTFARNRESGKCVIHGTLGVESTSTFWRLHMGWLF